MKHTSKFNLNDPEVKKHLKVFKVIADKRDPGLFDLIMRKGWTDIFDEYLEKVVQQKQSTLRKIK